MLEYLEQILLVLATGAAVAIIAKRIKIPYNVALVVVGLVLVLLNMLPDTPMEPSLVLLVFLPILVFQGAMSADDVSMRQAARPILVLALPGVALTLLATAAIASWEIGLPFPVALLMGAVLAITDTVSVLLAFRSVRVPHRLAAIMEGESLFNDGTALVLVGVTATVVQQGYADPAQIGRMLLVAIIAGLMIGVAFGTLGATVLRHAPDDLTALLSSIVTVFGTSLVAEMLHGSAVIAVVVAGVLVGMQLQSERLLQEAGAIVLAVIALHAGRAVAVYGCFGALHLAGEGVPWRWQHVMVFGNIKGALSMAAVLALPADIADRDRLIAIVFGVTLVTLVTQALPFRRFLNWLGVAHSAGDVEADERRAVLIGARRGQAELDSLLTAGLISRHEHAEQWASFQRDIIEAERVLRRISDDPHAGVALPAVLAARKAAILDAVRRGLITERTATLSVAALDKQILQAVARQHHPPAKEEP